MKPTTCLECGNEDTWRMGSKITGSFYCPKCGASWVNYISVTIKIDKEGDEADESSARTSEARGS